jgi:hypothetical protein
MINLDEIHDRCRPYIPAIPFEFFSKVAIDVARHICTETKQWTGDVDAVNTVAGERQYALTSSVSQSEIVSLSRLSVNSALLWDVRSDGRSSGSGDDKIPEYPAGSPPFVMLTGGTQLSLDSSVIPDESVTGGLVASAYLRPTVSATQLPDFFTEVDTQECLRNGINAHLLMIPGRTWSDPNNAIFYRSLYRTGLSEIANTNSLRNARAPLRVKKWG